MDVSYTHLRIESITDSLRGGIFMVKNGEETAKKEGKTTGNVLPVLLGTGTGLVLLLLLTLLAAGLIWSGVLPVSIAGMSLTIAAGLCALVGGRVAVNRGSGGLSLIHI